MIYYLLKQNKIKKYDISYTKYISKSIINISINNLSNSIFLPQYYYNIINDYYKLSNEEFKQLYNNLIINKKF